MNEDDELEVRIQLTFNGADANLIDFWAKINSKDRNTFLEDWVAESFHSLFSHIRSNPATAAAARMLEKPQGKAS